MRIGIDVRYLSHGLVGGLKIYIRDSVAALLDVANGHQIFLYADTKRPFELGNLPRGVTLRRLPYRTPLSSIYHDLFLRKVMARDRVEVAHFPANYGFGPAGARTILTIHDAINLMPLREIIRGHPKNPRTIGMMTYLHFMTQAALRSADLVTTVSAFSGKEIAHYGRVDARKIAVVPSACPSDMRRVTDQNELTEVRQRLNLTRPFILADAFKNPGVLLRAWRLLPGDLQKRIEIIFYARSSDVLPVVHQAITEGFARLLVRLPSRDLAALYSIASVFVFPSWIEGFGLPLLEAMTCGAPVIASDRGAIPEVAGDAAIIIDAEDERSLAMHLEAVLTDANRAQSLRERGLQRAAQFSWHRNARQMLECYARAQS
jgi:glycosyltransferase involved in cell wall biosynthesis